MVDKIKNIVIVLELLTKSVFKHNLH